MTVRPGVLFVCVHNAGQALRGLRRDDPAGKRVDAVRPIRDEIKARVEAPLTRIVPAP